MEEVIKLRPIGVVRADRSEAIDDHWDAVSSRIELDAVQYDERALAGLTEFSHIEVITWFHRVRSEKIQTGARHPRGREDWPLTGIFAQRGKNRPNRIGATICSVLKVQDLTIDVKGLDAIDGTPVLDIKPVMTAFLPRGEVREPAWVTELMSQYW